LLVRDVGLTPLEALQAATLHSAAFLGLDRELGSIEAGKHADLVLLDANPLEDITHISGIAGVVLRGRFFDRPGLARLMDDVAAAPDISVNDWIRVPKRSRATSKQEHRFSATLQNPFAQGPPDRQTGRSLTMGAAASRGILK
jgi:adenine deaminase